jgi:hypothetical protein
MIAGCPIHVAASPRHGWEWISSTRSPCCCLSFCLSSRRDLLSPLPVLPHPPQKTVILSEVTRALCELRSRRTCGCSCRCLFSFAPPHTLVILTLSLSKGKNPAFCFCPCRCLLSPNQPQKTGCPIHVAASPRHGWEWISSTRSPCCCLSFCLSSRRDLLSPLPVLHHPPRANRKIPELLDKMRAPTTSSSLCQHGHHHSPDRSPHLKSLVRIL